MSMGERTFFELTKNSPPITPSSVSTPLALVKQTKNAAIQEEEGNVCENLKSAGDGRTALKITRIACLKRGASGDGSFETTQEGLRLSTDQVKNARAAKESWPSA